MASFHKHIFPSGVALISYFSTMMGPHSGTSSLVPISKLLCQIISSVLCFFCVLLGSSVFSLGKEYNGNHGKPGIVCLLSLHLVNLD